jgi:tetratricopeptide (TPR) repeat protein
VALFTVTVACFSPSWRNGFVSIDDPAYILNNEPALDGVRTEGVLWAFTATRVGNWHPLTWIVHMLDVELLGVNPGLHHASSSLIHAFAAAIFLSAIAAATGRPTVAAFAAALFALHPLRVESVVWIAEKKDVLSGLFYVAAIWCHVRFAQHGRWRDRIFVVVAMTLACASKPTAVTLPFVLLLLDVAPLGRVADGARPGRALARLALEKTPLFAVAVATSVATIGVQEKAMAIGLPLQTRICNALVAVVRYLEVSVFPRDLCIFYPYELDALRFRALVALLTILVIAGFAFRARAHAPVVSIGLLWFGGGLVPMLGVIQVGAQAMADRYTYLPSMGLSLAIAVATASLVERAPRQRAAIVMICLCSLIVLTLCTVRQISWWRDSATLYARALRVAPSDFARVGLAQALLGGDAPDLARAYSLLFEDATPACTAQRSCRATRAAILRRTGRLADAIEAHVDALTLDPSSVEDLAGLAATLAAAGDEENALHVSGRAVLTSDDASLWILRGRLLDREGRIGEWFMEHARAYRARGAAPGRSTALAIKMSTTWNPALYKPDDAAAHANWAVAQTHRLDARALAGLASARLAQGRFADANVAIASALAAVRLRGSQVPEELAVMSAAAAAGRPPCGAFEAKVANRDQDERSACAREQ